MTGCGMSDMGCRMLDVGCWMSDFGYSVGSRERGLVIVRSGNA